MAIAGIFPGQGSQSIGMLTDLADSFPSIKDTFQQASDVLGFDLWLLTSAGDATELNQTVNTQPAMLAAGVAVWKVWLEQGGCQPKAVAGHSLGEYSALVAAGSLSFVDAMTMVRHRAQLMQDAVPEGTGAMAAVLGLDDTVVLEVCEKAANGDVVQAVNFNSPGQVVIAGEKAAVERAMALATEAGAKRVILLPVSVPSHCDLMHPAAEKLAEKLADVALGVASIPVIHNVSATAVSGEVALRDALKQQLFKPVQWVQSVAHLKAEYGTEAMVEFGPGKVLFGLNRRIDRKIKTLAVFDPASLEKALTLCEESV
ncbi:MAG TPA: [acyl-carrier-protein] S-malonyltransferase [Thiotrichaceae bacterium]|nr:[acyl-carrier-protein] S-malonyltransferase [Thiotrichaceae bacterium]